jgi:hypothetical protein
VEFIREREKAECGRRLREIVESILAFVRRFPELSKLKWTKTGSWDYQAKPLGMFGKIIRYHISRDAFFAIEMKLELEDLNEESSLGLAL